MHQLTSSFSAPRGADLTIANRYGVEAVSAGLSKYDKSNPTIRCARLHA
jgi:hypothetical protein